MRRQRISIRFNSGEYGLRYLMINPCFFQSERRSSNSSLVWIAMPVYDLTATPWRVIDWVVVGDGPEGFTISPTGKLAVPVLINGSAAAKNAWYYHTGILALLAIDGTKVTRVGEVEVGRLPEGAAFSPEGAYLYVANDLDDD